MKLNTEPTFLAGLSVQSRIIKALIVRDMMMRYGRANIGFLWVILEPMILTAGVMAMWSMLKSPYEHGLQIVAIVLTGYMPLTLFRHISGAGPNLLARSATLLYHRPISLTDVIISRAILEFCGTTSALIIVYSTLALSGIVSPIQNPGLAACAWLLMGLLSFGLLFLFSILTEYSDTSERFIQPFQYLMLPISGAFFMVDWLPYRAQQLIWFSPTVHCYEMFRAGFFGEAITTHYSWWYPLSWAFALTTVSIINLERVRDRLHMG